MVYVLWLILEHVYVSQLEHNADSKWLNTFKSKLYVSVAIVLLPFYTNIKCVGVVNALYIAKRNCCIPFNISMNWVTIEFIPYSLIVCYQL